MYATADPMILGLSVNRFSWAKYRRLSLPKFSFTSGTLLVTAVSTVTKTLLIFSVETCIAAKLIPTSKTVPNAQIMIRIKAKMPVNTTVMERMIRQASLLAIELFRLNMRGSFMNFLSNIPAKIQKKWQSVTRLPLFLC